jgi:hypothetical protein
MRAIILKGYKRFSSAKVCFIITVLISSFISAPAKAQEPSWIDDCWKTNSIGQSELRTAIVSITNAVLTAQKQSPKLSKADGKIIANAVNLSQKLIDLTSFACDKITEGFWLEIKDERVAELNRVKSQINPTLAKLDTLKGVEITCYKSGGTKIVTGKRPVCPKGYKKVS